MTQQTSTVRVKKKKQEQPQETQQQEPPAEATQPPITGPVTLTRERFVQVWSAARAGVDEIRKVMASPVAIVSVLLVALLSFGCGMGCLQDEASGPVDNYSVQGASFAGTTTSGDRFELEIPPELLVTTQEAANLREVHIQAKQAEAQAQLMKLQMQTFQQAYEKQQAEAEQARQAAEKEAAAAVERAVERGREVNKQQATNIVPATAYDAAVMAMSLPVAAGLVVATPAS